MDNDDYRIEIDTSAAPLFLVRYPPHITAELIVELFETYRQWSVDYDRVAYLFDLTRINPLTMAASLRTKFTEQFELNREVIERATVCEARCVASHLVQGVLMTTDLMTRRAYPCRNFTSMDKARAYAVKMLAAER